IRPDEVGDHLPGALVSVGGDLRLETAASVHGGIPFEEPVNGLLHGAGDRGGSGVIEVDERAVRAIEGGHEAMAADDEVAQVAGLRVRDATTGFNGTVGFLCLHLWSP